jgi:alpha-ketoglutarate-dependent taurine dioxygenase
MLDSGVGLPEPGVAAIHASATTFPDVGADELFAALAADGLAMVRLDRPLDRERFLAFGRLLGTAMPETDPAVQPYVEESVVLNLVTAYPKTGDPNLQPFAANSLNLHSEGSGRPAAGQPRYIVLMCCEPGVSTAAQTVLVPMSRVAAALSTMDLYVLERLRYRHGMELPTIVYTVAGRPVFSFRDFGSQLLEWTFAGDAVQSVNPALRALLAAMYGADVASGVRWKTGMLVVIDNTYFFHGRTSGVATTADCRRHLKRLRIAAPAR